MIYVHPTCPKKPSAQNENSPGFSVSDRDVKEFGAPVFCPWCGKRAVKKKE